MHGFSPHHSLYRHPESENRASSLSTKVPERTSHAVGAVLTDKLSPSGRQAPLTLFCWPGCGRVHHLGALVPQRSTG